MMMSEKEFIESQKDCASMLGMTLSEYQEFCKDAKANTEIEECGPEDYDISFLEQLGLSINDLKIRRNI